MATPAQVARFVKALFRFVGNGAEYLPKEKIEWRFAICKECTYFNGKWCRKCGCNCGNNQTFFNKLAMPTERCPVNRWPSEVQQSTQAD